MAYFLSSSFRHLRHYERLMKCSRLFSQCSSTGGTPLPFSEIPGPPGTISNLFEYTRYGGIPNLCEIQQRRFEKFGPIFSEKLFNRRIVNISDADAIAKVLRAEPAFPMRPGFEAFEKCLEEHDHVSGLASNDRDLWYKERALLSTKMMRPKEVNQCLAGFNAVSRDFVDQVRRLLQEDHVLPNLENELFFWAAETISTFLFDQRLGFYNHPPDPTAVVFVNAAVDLNEGLGKLLFGLPLYKYFNTPNYNRFRKAVNILYTVGQDIVNATEAKKRERGEKSTGDERAPSLFDHISSSGEFTSKAIVNILIGMMNAGVDTTTIVVLWTIYLLTQYPESQEKLYQELKSVLGDQTEVSAQTIGRLSYLKACVKESMRLRPPTIVTPRKLDHDFEVLGYTVPAGVEMMLYTHVLSVAESHYGKDAKYFVPERWLRGEGDGSGRKEMYHPFTTLPFGYGVRMCIGRRIAEAEIYCLLSQLVLNFRMEYAGIDEPRQHVSVLVKPDRPLEVKFIPR